MSPLKKYRFARITPGHWLFGWLAYVDEQVTHHAPVVFGAYGPIPK